MSPAKTVSLLSVFIPAVCAWLTNEKPPEVHWRHLRENPSYVMIKSQNIPMKVKLINILLLHVNCSGILVNLWIQLLTEGQEKLFTVCSVKPDVLVWSLWANCSNFLLKKVAPQLYSFLRLADFFLKLYFCSYKDLLLLTRLDSKGVWLKVVNISMRQLQHQHLRCKTHLCQKVSLSASGESQWQRLKRAHHNQPGPQSESLIRYQVFTQSDTGFVGWYRKWLYRCKPSAEA